MTQHPPTFKDYLDIFAAWLAIGFIFMLPISTTLSNILFIAAPVVSCCAGNWAEKFPAILQRRAVFMFFLLFGYLLIATLYSTASHQEVLNGLSKYDKLLFGLFFIPIFLKEKWRIYAIHAFLAGICVTLCCAAFQLLGIIGPDPQFGPLLLFKDRIQTSFLMAMSAYFCGVLFFETMKQKIRWIYASLFLLSLIYLFLIGGRSGYFVFFALLALIFWEKWKWRGIICYLIVSPMILFSAYFFSPVFGDRVQEIFKDAQMYSINQKNTSTGLRVEFVKNSFSIIKEHPIFGTGTGSFPSEYAKLHTPITEQTQNPHNEYINITVQLGTVGLALLLLMFFMQWQDSRFLPSEMRQIARGTVLAIVLGCCANSWLMDTTEGHFYVYFIALTFAAFAPNRENTGLVQKIKP